MEEHLIKEIARRFRRMPASKRIAEVREFMGRSAAHRELIEKAFPELHREATSPIPRPSAVSSSESARPIELCAKPR
jgi:hypothetical protein